MLPIQIPKGFSVIVREGDVVAQGQVVARRSERFLERRIPLSTLLNVSPKKAAKLLRKNPGDSLREGELLAAKPSFISVTEVVSQVSGTMLRFEHESGDLVFELQVTDQTVMDVSSPFAGTVREVAQDHIGLDTKNGGGVVATKGLGGNAEGMLLLLDPGPSGVADGQAIVVDMIGNIVLGPSFSREALVKASGVGVAGIVAAHIADDDVAFLAEKRMLLPILIVGEESFRSLAKLVGKKVYLDTIGKTVLTS
jgi:biotin carboxyl carrier protein